MRRLLSAALAAMAMVSCSTVSKGPGGQVSKVKYYELDPTERITASDRSLVFERSYHLHGAVTQAEQMERAGHYYSVFWKVNDRTQPVTVRFEYRQSKSGLKVKTIDQEATDIGRDNLTKFDVTGEAYRADGPISAWRVSLLRGKEVLATQESYLWN